MATPIEQAKTKLKQKNARLPVGPVSRFFAPVPDKVRVRDIIRELPGAAVEVGKTVIQETALAPVRTALSLADIPRTATGKPPLPPVKVPFVGEAKSAQRDVTERIEAGEDPLLAALGAGSLAVLDVATLGLAAQQVVSFLRGSSNAAISKAAISIGEPTTFNVGKVYDMTIGKTPPAGSIQNKIEVFLRDPFFRQMKKENFKGGLLDYLKTKGFEALRIFGDDGVSKVTVTPQVVEPIAAEAIGAVARPVARAVGKELVAEAVPKLPAPALATGEGITTRVLEKVAHKPYTTLQELREMSRSADVPPLEKEFWNELTAEGGLFPQGKRVSVAEVERIVQEKAIKLDIEETDKYASYGLDNLGDADVGKPVTLLFRNTGIQDIGTTRHFGAEDVYGHARVSIVEEGDKKVLKIFETQSDFNQQIEVEKALLDKYGFKDKLDQKREELSIQKGEFANVTQEEWKAAHDALANELIAKMTPQDKQILNLSRSRRYLDRINGELLTWARNKGVTEVHYPTPSTVSKIEWGKGLGDEVMPYTRPDGRRFTTDDSLDFGDEIDHAGQNYRVINVDGDDIVVAPSDKVRDYDVYELATESARSDFENRELYDIENIKKETGFDVTSEGGAQSYLNLIKPKRDELLALEAQRYKWVSEWGETHPKQNVEQDWLWRSRGETAWAGRFTQRRDKLKELERELQHESSDTLTIIDEVAAGKDWDTLQENYEQSYLENFDAREYLEGFNSEVYFEDIGRGERAWVVESSGETLNLSQPSRYTDLDPEDLSAIDTNRNLLEDLGFSKSEKGVLNNYYHGRDQIEKELRKQKLKGEFITDDSQNRWFKFPMTKFPRYLFGATPLALPQAKE